MVALKGRAVQAFIKNPDKEALVVLVYGPDRGLVSETVANLIKSSGIKASDPFALVRITADQLAVTPSLLNDEISTPSMFEDRRLIWVRAEGRDLSASITDALDLEPQDMMVIIEAGDLKPTSPLRKLAEKHEKARALPCYSDDTATLSGLIASYLEKAGKSIDRDALVRLSGLLGQDRQLTLKELEKLCLYVGDRDIINLDDVELAIADTSQLSLDQMIDAMALGDVRRASVSLHRLLADGYDCGVLAGLVLRHFHLLARLRSDVDRGALLQQSLKSVRPPVFFKRHALIERQVSRWPLSALEAIIQRISDAEKRIRLSPLFSALDMERLVFAVSLYRKA